MSNYGNHHEMIRMLMTESLNMHYLPHASTAKKTCLNHHKDVTDIFGQFFKSLSY